MTVAQLEPARIAFTVPAIPVAQPRAKATTVNGFARMYEAGGKHPVHAFKATCRMAAAEAYQGPPLDGPLAVTLLFLFPAKAKRARKPKATRPDCDNLAKSLLDALNGRLFVDDSQVVRLAIEKWHAAGDEQPRVEVRIEPLTP
jgi:Holliday junction resolvase RusA-like endonuclease